MILQVVQNLQKEVSNLRSDFTASQKETVVFRDEMYRFREDVYRRFDEHDKRFDRVQKVVEHNENRLDQIYESREKVKVTFGWQWGMVSLFIAVIASAMTKILA